MIYGILAIIFPLQATCGNRNKRAKRKDFEQKYIPNPMLFEEKLPEQIRKDRYYVPSDSER